MYGDNMLYDVVQSWNKSEIVFYLDTHALYVGAQIWARDLCYTELYCINWDCHFRSD